MKENIASILVSLLIGIALAAFLTYATSAKVWYADEHTANCNNTQKYGCYEKLLAADKAR